MRILSCRDLKKHYPQPVGTVKALDGVDLEFADGQFAAIVGSSGSGKSTLLHMLGGLDAPTSGEVIVRDQRLGDLSERALTIFRRRNIGFVFQRYNLIGTLDVKSNITLPLELDGRRVDSAFLEEICTVLGLSKLIDRYPDTLSGGQQQRVAIARALIGKPAIILADEPTGNLDSVTSLEVVGLLKLTSGRFGQTTVMITHDEQLAGLCDRIIRIEDGRIVPSFSRGA